MKIVFAGTPEFAAQAMRAIYAAGHEIVLAFTQPDRRAGRGMHLQASPVKEFALENFGIISFDSIQREKLYSEAVRLLKKQANPRAVFYSLASFLRSNQVEIPGFI